MADLTLKARMYESECECILYPCTGGKGKSQLANMWSKAPAKASKAAAPSGNQQTDKQAAAGPADAEEALQQAQAVCSLTLPTAGTDHEQSWISAASGLSTPAAALESIHPASSSW